MKRAIFNAGVGVGILASSVAGCGNHETTPATPNPTVVSAEARAYVETKFGQYTDYLKSLGRVATSTRLVILSGNESFTCGVSPEESAHTLSSWTNSEYCATTDTVVITGGTINAAIYDGQKDAQISFTVGHELGHAEQAQESELKAGLTTAQHARIEEQATCFGGEDIGRFDPAQVAPIENILSTTPMDSLHGPSMAQAAAFKQGAQGGPCPLESY